MKFSRLLLLVSANIENLASRRQRGGRLLHERIHVVTLYRVFAPTQLIRNLHFDARAGGVVAMIRLAPGFF